jgi:hypothetical protein
MLAAVAPPPKSIAYESDPNIVAAKANVKEVEVTKV